MAVKSVSFVRAVRALLEAHGRMSRNALLRDAGPKLAAVASALVVLLWLVLTLPMASMMFFVGAASTGTTAWAGTVYSVVPLISGLVALFSADGRELDWEKLASYPVRPQVLFTAEAIAVQGNPVLLSTTVCLVGLAMGQLVAQAAGVVPVLVCLLTSILLTLSVRVFLATVAQLLVSRARTLVVVTFVSLPMVVLWLIDAFSEGGEDREKFLQAIELLKHLGEWLPASRQLTGGFDSLSSVTRLLGPLALPLVLLWVTYRAAFLGGPRVRAVHKVAPERLWSFRSPTLGLARLHILSLWSTELGRWAIAAPIFWVVPLMFLRSKLSGEVAGDTLYLSLWVMTPMMSLGMVLNQFGTDRGAVKGLLLLPVSARQLLHGKALALGALLAGEMLLLTPVAIWLFRPDPAVLLNGPLMAVAVLLIQLSLGQFVSVMWPRPLPRKGLRQPPGGLLVGLVSIGTVFGVLLPILGLSYALREWPLVLSLILGALCAASFSVFVGTTGLAERFLVARQERLVESLS